MNTKETLKRIISEYTGINPNDLNDDMDIRMDAGLDSFSMISMLNEIESECGVEIPESEITSFSTIGDLINFIDNNK